MSTDLGKAPRPRLAVAALISGLLLFGVVAAMVAALLQTLSLTITNPVPVDGSNLGVIGSAPIDFADRLGVFASAGTNLTIVLMLVAAAALTRLSSEGTWHRAACVLIGLLAAIVMATDVVMAVEVVTSHGPLFIIGVDATSRATGVVGLLAPAALAAAAAAGVTRLGHRPAKEDPSALGG